MTLCVGALCDNRKTIVLVAERMFGVGFAEAELNIRKATSLHKDWMVMLAGNDVSPGSDIIDDIRDSLNPHRAHEEDRPVTARASRTDPQLFPRSEAALQRGCRGPEQQSQTHNEKILRIPHLPLSRTRPLSLTWQITGAGINPRFFLTNQSIRIMSYFGEVALGSSFQFADPHGIEIV